MLKETLHSLKLRQLLFDQELQASSKFYSPGNTQEIIVNIKQVEELNMVRKSNKEMFSVIKDIAYQNFKLTTERTKLFRKNCELENHINNLKQNKKLATSKIFKQEMRKDQNPQLKKSYLKISNSTHISTETSKKLSASSIMKKRNNEEPQILKSQIFQENGFSLKPNLKNRSLSKKLYKKIGQLSNREKFETKKRSHIQYLKTSQFDGGCTTSRSNIEYLPLFTENENKQLDNRERYVKQSSIDIKENKKTIFKDSMINESKKSQKANEIISKNIKRQTLNLICYHVPTFIRNKTKKEDEEIQDKIKKAKLDNKRLKNELICQI